MVRRTTTVTTRTRSRCIARQATKPTLLQYDEVNSELGWTGCIDLSKISVFMNMPFWIYNSQVFAKRGDQPVMGLIISGMLQLAAI
ncbi:hypothetical protein F443_10287 [Phytophthora nicotianae P1569]|uniref:Uncharacterized protein n=1 Tax=Phytophthora nicotianae P1569 TaxID=1317065 RepID=V9F0L9_PHYNI|nr:hypothetical protein F443_10287 [Phytophthora nicotianae P1569]